MAPNSTIAQGSAGRAARREGAASGATCGVDWRDLSSAIGDYPCGVFRGSRRLPASRFRRLDMAAEAEAHGRQHFLAESLLLPRAEAGVERGGQHIGRNRFLDRRLDGPAALAGILDKAGEMSELRIARQGRRAEIEQPGRDHAAAPPDLGDVGQVELEALVLGQFLGESLLRRMSKPSA